MRTQRDPDVSSCLALELFRPDPRVHYSLDATAHLAGVPRRSILIYCRAGLVRPTLQPPYGMMTFDGEAICAVRRLERVRAALGLDVAWIKTVFDLLDEVERLRAELRFPARLGQREVPRFPTFPSGDRCE